MKSEWCPPCRLIAPELESFAAERYAVKVVNVDVDANHAVASRYGIRGVQTVALFRDEKPVATSAGAEPWWANEAAPGPRTQGARL